MRPGSIGHIDEEGEEVYEHAQAPEAPLPYRVESVSGVAMRSSGEIPVKRGGREIENHDANPETVSKAGGQKVNNCPGGNPEERQFRVSILQEEEA